MKRYDLQADYPRLVERLRAWCGEGLSAAAIAERLNAEGFRPPKRAERFNRGMVQRLLWHLGLARREPHGSLAGLGRDEYRPGGLARRLGIVAGHGAAVAPCRLADVASRRRGPPRDLGRRLRAAPAAGAPPPAPDLGERRVAWPN